MYDSCLYCSKSLGENDLFEHLTVGRRIAFDGGNGRLWVICTACVKWNLVPFDARLEAIDACERTFRATRTRFSTDNIGLARHAAGVDLIRIGSALRPEFAAWRYGESIARRRRTPGALGADAAGVLNWILASLTGGQLASLPLRDVTAGAMRAIHQHCVLRDPWTDQLVCVPYAALVQSSVSMNGSGAWKLEVPYRTGLEYHLNTAGSALPSIRDVPTLGLFGGAEVLPTLGRVLPALAEGVSPAAQVAEAVRLIEASGSTERLFAYVPGAPIRFAARRDYLLREVPPEVRLALEMVAHEDTEQRAMEGELKLLERQWRDAEQVAAIADRLAFVGRSAGDLPV